MDAKRKDYILHKFGPQCGGYPTCLRQKSNLSHDGELCPEYNLCNTWLLMGMLNEISDLEKKAEKSSTKEGV